MRRTGFVLVLASALVVALAAVGAAGAAPKKDASLKISQQLRKAVTVEGILEHERAFQAIADANGGTRASGTPGYDASAAYAADELRAAGYEVTVQPFDFPYFQELAPAELRQVSPTAEDYETVTFTYSGSGDVTGEVVPIDVVVPAGGAPNSSTSGCEASDFTPASATEEQVALLQRGTCPFAAKAANAEAAGYDAVIIFNEGQPGRQDLFAGTLGSPDFGIPVVGASYADGAELVEAARAGEAVVRVFASTLSEVRTTSNVIADTPTGRDDRAVVVGSHLDSVEEGPGINDNGSGSAQDLEIALQMAKKNVKTENTVRFAFWGAEESGLLGSEHYVENLSDGELADIAVNLNFDMVGSPNYARFVYDGDGSDTQPAGPEGSANVERIFADYFASQGLAYSPTQFSGRSDYGPFIAEGIPAGGLFTGAEGVKTPEEAAVYGGVAGIAYDPCYHSACDDLTEPNTVPALEAAYGEDVLLGNLNLNALDEMSDAAAHATVVFAQTEASVGDITAAKNPGKGPKGGLTFDGPRARK